MLEEMENIKYGNLETAMYYCERNKIGEWINRNLEVYSEHNRIFQYRK